MNMKTKIGMSIGCLMLIGLSGCLSYSHYKYSKRAEAARALPEARVEAGPGSNEGRRIT